MTAEGHRPRLLHVAQPIDGGVARCVVQLARQQRDEGIDVLVACAPVGELADALTDEGIAVVAWTAQRSPGPATLSEARALRAIVREVSPDLVHLHSAKAGLTGRLALRGRLPTVFSPHAWSFEAVTGPVARASVAWERFATRWTALLVCVSDAERATGEGEGVRAPRAVVVPNGVDLTAFPAADAEDRRAARRRLGIDLEAPTVVCVGRLARQKGQDVLLDAWGPLSDEHTGAQLLLVGDGPDRRALEERRVDRVTLIGARTDVLDWYTAADVVVVPSRWEGMALVPLEAMACARSVVVSDVAGVRESVPPEAGAVVPPEDAPALARALSDRLCGRVDPDAEGRSGRRHVAAHHDVRDTTARTTAAGLALLRR